MGNTYCFNENHKLLNVEKHTESIILTPNSSGQKNLPQPTRTHLVEQIYQKLIRQRPLSYSIERFKHKFQTYSVNIFGEQGIFIGDMMDGQPNGPGQIYFFNNNYLEATFANGDIDTQDAIMIENNGNYYRGGFKESVQTGSGILRTSGSEWKGKFEAGRIVGTGELRTPDGKIYKGTFSNGKMEGKGRLLDEKGNVYEGYFKEGRRHGIGHFSTQHYQYYGPYQNDMKQGKGTLILPKDEKYQGWFDKDKAHGYGEWHRRDGHIIKHNYVMQELSYFYN